MSILSGGEVQPVRLAQFQVPPGGEGMLINVFLRANTQYPIHLPKYLLPGNFAPDIGSRIDSGFSIDELTSISFVLP